MTEIMYEIPSREDVKRCIVSKETVEKKAKPALVLENGKLLEEREATAS